MKNIMRIPIPILKDLPQEFIERWSMYYSQASDRNRTQEEGIWRRTQTSENAYESGWINSDDCRRRIVYYLHNFDLIEKDRSCDLVMSHMYIYYSLSLPIDELNIVQQNIATALAKGGWSQFVNKTETIWQLGDLFCYIEEFKDHPEDIRMQRKMPLHYRSMDTIIRTRKIGNVQPQLPWEVLAKGMRVKDFRENPYEVQDLSVLKELQPFHVEVGCGLSIEAGIPALHHLHDLYRVTDLDTGKFIFGDDQDDLIPRLLANPEMEIPQLGSLFSASFLAQPTNAHQALLTLKKRGHLIEPILTNNFDGLIYRSGLSEQFLRRYDELIPPVEFDRRAKSLLVIGSHADRRRVQARARKEGLQIVYLDTEGYLVNGRFVPYPLEGPKDKDILCRKSATKGLVELCRILEV